MTPEHRWTCLGILPHVQPCGAHGTTDTEAADHTKQTQHATSSGPARGVEAMRRGFGGRPMTPRKHRTANARSISSSLLDEPIEPHDPETIRAAALTIAEHARDAEDMRVLLAMCGVRT